MKIVLRKDWRGKSRGESLDVGEVLAGSLIRRGIADATIPPKDKAKRQADVSK